VCAVFGTACGRGAYTPTAEQAGGKQPEAKATKHQIVSSAEEQATGKIETQAVETTDEPVLLHVSGRIARADDRTWRVGVRTNGLVRSVFVNLGDAVRKSQILTRYHAHERRGTSPNYRNAMLAVPGPH